jgi:hypothetical protein
VKICQTGLGNKHYCKLITAIISLQYCLFPKPVWHIFSLWESTGVVSKTPSLPSGLCYVSLRSGPGVVAETIVIFIVSETGAISCTLGEDFTEIWYIRIANVLAKDFYTVFRHNQEQNPLQRWFIRLFIGYFWPTPNKDDGYAQPRSQALPSFWGKTLVGAGHVTNRKLIT